MSDFAVSDLIAEGPDQKTKPWIGTGKKARKATLKIDGKKTVKGSVDYEVEFCACRIRPCCHGCGVCVRH